MSGNAKPQRIREPFQLVLKRIQNPLQFSKRPADLRAFLFFGLVVRLADASGPTARLRLSVRGIVRRR